MTGIEMIEQLTKDMDELKKQLALIDSTLKVLSNRVGKLLTGAPAVQQGMAQQAIASPEQMQVQVKTPEPPTQRPQLKQEGPSQAVKTGRLVYKKVFGYLKNQQGKAIEEALVLVYNARNEACASAISDATGRWETMLTPGKYVAEFKKDNFPAVNRTFEFTEFVKEYEVK